MLPLIHFFLSLGILPFLNPAFPPKFFFSFYPQRRPLSHRFCRKLSRRDRHIIKGSQYTYSTQPTSFIHAHHFTCSQLAFHPPTILSIIHVISLTSYITSEMALNAEHMSFRGFGARFGWHVVDGARSLVSLSISPLPARGRPLTHTKDKS